MKISTRFLVLFFAALSFSACGGQPQLPQLVTADNQYGDGQERLPDDPEQEVATESKGDEAEVLALTFKKPAYTATQKASILAKYNHLDPKKMIKTGLLGKAVLYYHANLANIPKKTVLTVLDYSLSSKENRMFIINMKTGAVRASRMAHGSGSDRNHDGIAEAFSNVSESHQSSIGPMLTAETYHGSKGYSLRLDGLASTNSRVRSRAVVIHGSSYVQDRSVIQGRSWGCPAIPNATRTLIIDAVKGGSLIYAGLSNSLSATP